MSKRGGFPGGNFGGMNINKLMKEAKRMQADMEKSQEELQAKEFEATCRWRSNYSKSNRSKGSKRNKNTKKCCRSR